jgi:hypothetical protein
MIYYWVLGTAHLAGRTLKLEQQNLWLVNNATVLQSLLQQGPLCTTSAVGKMFSEMLKTSVYPQKHWFGNRSRKSPRIDRNY